MIPLTEPALDAAPKSFNLVIAESELKLHFFGCTVTQLKKK